MNVNTTSQVAGQAVKSSDVNITKGTGKPKAAEARNRSRVEINLPSLSNQPGRRLAVHEGKENEINQALNSIKSMLASKQIDLRWQFDDKTNSIVIKFVERESNRLIRQVPPEEVLRLREHINEILGMIYDHKV
ncbi:MAG: hypothetical protein GF315_07630 [candidate division Zixibacteria bacterium]|nr:hypothetical protein [candidate division Zixibacteria bacterium]